VFGRHPLQLRDLAFEFADRTLEGRLAENDLGVGLVLFRIRVHASTSVLAHESLHGAPKHIPGAPFAANAGPRPFAPLAEDLLLFVSITGFRLLRGGWVGFVVAFFATVAVANALMSLFALLRQQLKHETLEARKDEQELDGEGA
jgi:hypothetical protein